KRRPGHVGATIRVLQFYMECKLGGISEPSALVAHQLEGSWIQLHVDHVVCRQQLYVRESDIRVSRHLCVLLHVPGIDDSARVKVKFMQLIHQLRKAFAGKGCIEIENYP